MALGPTEKHVTFHNPLSRDFAIKMRRLHDFAEMVERTFVAEVEALDARIAGLAEQFPDEDKGELYEYHAEDYVELADELPTLLRYAVLTAADAALEVYLNDTCETYAELRGVSIRVKDLKGNGIRRARFYLKKVSGVPFPDSSVAWTDVLRLHELRNSIVHADGLLPPTESAVRDWAVAVPGLGVSRAGVITLDKSFTVSALERYDAFVEAVDTACEMLGLWESVFPFEDA